MQQKKICLNCGQKPSRFNCVSCSSPVCEDCYDKTSMLCVMCRSKIANVGQWKITTYHKL